MPLPPTAAANLQTHTHTGSYQSAAPAAVWVLISSTPTSCCSSTVQLKDLRSSTLVSSSTPGGLYILPACTCCQALIKPRVHNTHVAQQTAEQLNLQHVGGWKVSSCHCKLCIMAPKYQTSNMHARSGANANMLLCVVDTLRCLGGYSQYRGSDIVVGRRRSRADDDRYGSGTRRLLLWKQSEQQIL